MGGWLDRVIRVGETRELKRWLGTRKVCEEHAGSQRKENNASNDSDRGSEGKRQLIGFGDKDRSYAVAAAVLCSH